TVQRVDQELVLTVQDDGVGFDVHAAAERGRRGNSMGLLIMEERVRLGGGELSLQSTPGSGTEIRVRFPLTKERDDDVPGTTPRPRREKNSQGKVDPVSQPKTC